MEFEEDRIGDFLSYFDGIKDRVNNFPGCYGMKLYQDINKSNVVFTYSHWESVDDLNNYRDSDTFGEIWPKIKMWFCNKPEAWTVNAYFNGFEERK